MIWWQFPLIYLALVTHKKAKDMILKLRWTKTACTRLELTPSGIWASMTSLSWTRWKWRLRSSLASCRCFWASRWKDLMRLIRRIGLHLLVNSSHKWSSLHVSSDTWTSWSSRNGQQTGQGKNTSHLQLFRKLFPTCWRAEKSSEHLSSAQKLTNKI